jgi:hypothetical protein
VKATSIIRNGILSIGLAASLAAGSMGIGSAEARINGDAMSPFAQQCKNIQDLFDAAVRDYYDATTPGELEAARAVLNIWSARWKELGCDKSYGNIQFIVAGSANVILNTGLTVQPATPSTSVGGAPQRGR